MGNFQEGDIVQIVDDKHHWYPCLIIVTEPRNWGIIGYITLPNNTDEGNGNAFIRLKNEAVELVGKAAIIRADASASGGDSTVAEEGSTTSLS